MDYKTVVDIGNYIYRSFLYDDYYAIDFIQKIDNDFVRVRCPYTTEDSARSALTMLKNKRIIPLPDYKIEYVKGGTLCRVK